MKMSSVAATPKQSQRMMDRGRWLAKLEGEDRLELWPLLPNMDLYISEVERDDATEGESCSIAWSWS